MKKHNFYAGPAILPAEVLMEASEAVRELDHIGLSLIEISHRGREFMAIMEEAQSLVKELYKLPNNFEVLYLQGGASTQFCIVPYNLLPEGGAAAYLDTGAWSTKAIEEAGIFGKVDVLATSSDDNYRYIPKDFDVRGDYSYIHITTNNTIYGTEIYSGNPLAANIMNHGAPIVADMSSDIFSEELGENPYDLIYAGAQKNLGPAGATLVIVKKELLGLSERKIPSILDYAVHAGKESMFNTPPVFAVYCCLLTLRWIKRNGGLSAVGEANRKKADLLYGEIDRNPLFEGTVRAAHDRSRMNVTFVLKDASAEEAFLSMTKEAGIVGIKGHRSVGGFRASLYNALPVSSVEVLIEVMQEFERTR